MSAQRAACHGIIPIVRLIFDSALDGPAWPGPLGHADFVFGESWVGPRGLLDVLETRLGLGGYFDGPLQRACRLIGPLQSLSGHWRQSFDVDPLGTCRRLLSDRDRLRLWGWTGQPVSSRLAELNEATAGAMPGTPDRLEAVAQALASRPLGIESLVSHTLVRHLAPLWRNVFDSLRRAGVAIDERMPPPAPALGDLAGARTTGFVPTGDGRLCLLRRHGPLDLADEVAAALAAHGSLDDVVIIGADDVLDQALARHGLPRVGAHAGPPASSGLLPLVLEAAFHPMEMGDLHALIAADPGPIPKGLAVRLIDAIRQWPGRRTIEWKEGLTAGLSLTDEEKREEVERRATALLMPVCGRNERLPVPALRQRLDVLAAWARARSPFVPSLVDLSERIQNLLEAVVLTGADAFSWNELRRLSDDLGEPVWTWEPAQTGLAHVARPGAILAPARAIVWWNFSRDTATRPNRLLLTRAERDGLRALGIDPPDSSSAIAIEVEGWHRPLLQAREALTLACPLTDASGESNHPHPLWDNVIAALADPLDARKLERSHVVHLAPAKVVDVPSRVLVTAAPVVTLTSPITLREIESPSSVEKLLGCSLSWALEYRARIRPGLSFGPQQPGPRLFGSLAHRILEQVLALPMQSPDEVADVAGTLFDQQCADLCEVLALPQHQAGRATVRRAVTESARALVRLARKHGVRTIKTEVAGRVVAAGQSIDGRLDHVWEDPDVVIDLKWGKRTQVEKLETGSAVQLAAYAAMRKTEGRSAETAYFILQNQQLLSEPGGRLAGDARMQGTYVASDTWSAVVEALVRRRDAVSRGMLEAPGAAGDEVRSSFSPGGLAVAPPCKYCGFNVLCGREGAR